MPPQFFLNAHKTKIDKVTQFLVAMRIFTKVLWQTPITVKFRLDLISKCFDFLKNHSCYTYLHLILIQKNYEVLLDTDIPLNYM